MQIRVGLLAALAIFLLPCLAAAATHQKRTSGGHYIQGGHYAGGHGSAHRGGHYVNPRTANHYQHHPRPAAATSSSSLSPHN
jgi:hypothetical protein